jgi:hypothetical protein
MPPACDRAANPLGWRCPQETGGLYGCLSSHLFTRPGSPRPRRPALASALGPRISALPFPSPSHARPPSRFAIRHLPSPPQAPWLASPRAPPGSALDPRISAFTPLGPRISAFLPIFHLGRQHNPCHQRRNILDKPQNFSTNKSTPLLENKIYRGTVVHVGINIGQ